MSNLLPPSRLSFEENIKSLLEELLLADKWERPSLLLAIHKTKFGQQKAESELQAELEKLGQHVIPLIVDSQHSDVPHLIVSTPAPDHTVFFVSNLDWGGGADRMDAYRALNIYRELFVDNHVRAVFWLTTNEAATLARFAPDFWAFRHRVIEFTGQRIPRLVKLPAGTLLWDVQNSVDPHDSLDARIAVREELLGKLPHNNEARSARVDLLHNLGNLYWERGDAAEAARQLLAGLDLTVGQQGDHVRCGLLNGLAILAYEAGDYARAVEHLRAALEEAPDDALLLINLSICCNALGRNQEAIGIAKKAIKSGGRDGRIWSGLGYLYAAMGKYDDAITCFSKAVELAPRNARFHTALAVCYHLVERSDESAHEFGAATKLASDQARITLPVYEALLAGDAGKAQSLAGAEVQARRISRIDLLRDPTLSLLADPEQIREMSA